MDGDGHISVTDLFFAKQFDQDKDGKLNEKELATAKEALSKGYKDRFMLGLERTGPVKSVTMLNDAGIVTEKARMNDIRIIQRDGKILVGDDFTPLIPPK